MLVVSSKSNLGGEAGCGLRFHGRRMMLGSWSDHARIIPALEMMFHLFLEIFLNLAVSFFVPGAVFGEVG